MDMLYKIILGVKFWLAKNVRERTHDLCSITVAVDSLTEDVLAVEKCMTTIVCCKICLCCYRIQSNFKQTARSA
jgi:hypothetical protein